MNARVVSFALGRLCQVNAGCLALPLLFALLDPHTPPARFGHLFPPETGGFLVGILASLVLGTLLVRQGDGGREIQHAREGFAVVAGGWLLLTALGAIPFAAWLHHAPAAPAPGDAARALSDAFFETMSGFTTTGATILSDVEALPRALLLWRALTHWLGGMGIITLALAVFPTLGVSGYQMFQSEVPGPTADRLMPRLAETAKILWGVYVLLTAAETLLLWLAGMGLFDALCHAFATLATGGFSTRNASIAAYASPAIDWIVLLFMYLAGVNFLLHWRALRGRLRESLADEEWRLYTGAVLAASLFCAGMLYWKGIAPPHEARAAFRANPLPAREFSAHLEREAAKVATAEGVLRHSLFQVLTVTTTTGFATCDFDVWPAPLRALLVLLMFMGGCAGSTGGGIKAVRVLVTARALVRDLRVAIQPRLLASLKVNGRPLGHREVYEIALFVIASLALVLGGTFAMSFFLPDLETAATAVVASLFNIGPGLAGVGAIENYGFVPLPGKWILALLMLAGRLELFTVLVFLLPSIWRR